VLVAVMSRVLLVGGSLNQTTMMHRIGEALADVGVECRYSPFFADGVVGLAARRGWLDFTILGGKARARSVAYLEDHALPVDEGGESGRYDLVVTGTDIYVPARLRGRPMVLVQEGMFDPETWRYHVTRRLGPLRALANTASTGLSHAYQRFCVASEGFRELAISKGCVPSRVVVTGIPNFDDCESFRDNDLPLRGYVLAATSCLRETGKPEDRIGFLRRARAIAEERGRPLVVKLHPNERHDRAEREARSVAPDSTVIAHANTDHLVANCDVLVTRYSSVVLVGAALGKEVVSDINPSLLARLTPVQNGGRSASLIADECIGLMRDRALQPVP
jgi:hypothetical protein